MLILQSRTTCTVSYFTLLDIFLYGLLKGYKAFLEIYGAGYKLKLVNIDEKFGLVLRIGYSQFNLRKFIKKF